MKINPAHFERMYKALKTIAKDYQTPEQLRRNCEKQYGLGYEETLEMSYENIQQLAKDATKGIRLPKVKSTQSPSPTQTDKQ
jgi:hypothetical protein